MINPSHVKRAIPRDCDRGREFVAILENMAPVVDHGAGLGGVSW